MVNTWDRISVERWIFTAAHELGHLLLHPDTFDVAQTQEDESQDQEASIFASHFLMPQESFAWEWQNAWGLGLFDRVMKVKRVFRVSYQTVLHRLSRTTEPGCSVWDRLQADYKCIGGKALRIDGEPSSLLRAEEPECLSQLDFVPGRLPGLVRDAIETQVISLSQGAEILGLDLAKMRERAASWPNA